MTTHGGWPLQAPIAVLNCRAQMKGRSPRFNFLHVPDLFKMWKLSILDRDRVHCVPTVNDMDWKNWEQTRPKITCPKGQKISNWQLLITRTLTSHTERHHSNQIVEKLKIEFQLFLWLMSDQEHFTKHGIISAVLDDWNMIHHEFNLEIRFSNPSNAFFWCHRWFGTADIYSTTNLVPIVKCFR